MTPAFMVGEGFCVVWLVITLMSFNLQESDVLRKITYILYQQLLTQRINFYSTVMSIYLVKLSPYGNAFEGSAPCVHFILTTRQQMKCFYKEWWGQFIPNVFVYLLHTVFNIIHETEIVNTSSKFHLRFAHTEAHILHIKIG